MEKSLLLSKWVHVLLYLWLWYRLLQSEADQAGHVTAAVFFFFFSGLVWVGFQLGKPDFYQVRLQVTLNPTRPDPISLLVSDVLNAKN